MTTTDEPSVAGLFDDAGYLTRDPADSSDAPSPEGGEPGRPAADAPGPAWWQRAFRTYRVLLVPAALGLVLRLWIIVGVHPECTPTELARGSTTCYRLVGDALYYRGQAHYLAKGHGFLNPTALNFGDIRPGAYHPPLFTVVLAILDLLGLRSIGAHRFALSVIGVAGAVVVGLVAWRIARPHLARTTGIVATSIVAANPLFWLNETTSMSESVYVPLVALMVLCAYRFREAPTFRRAAVLGVAIGLTMLTRAEAAAFVGVAALLLWGLRSLTTGHRLKLLLTIGLVALVVVAPWLLYNLSRFPNQTLMTTSTGDALVFRSCDQAFYGEKLGYYDLACDPKPNLSIEDESAQDVRSRAIAMEYIGSHLDRFPVVLAARFGRMVEVYRPDQNAKLSALLDNRGVLESRLALGSYYLLLVPAWLGLRELRKRTVAVSPILMLLAVVTAAALMTSPVVRYRIAGDLGLVLLAAVGGVAHAGRATAWLRKRWMALADGGAARLTAAVIAVAVLLAGAPVLGGSAGAGAQGLPTTTTTTTAAPPTGDPAPMTTTTYPGNPKLPQRLPTTVVTRDPATLVPVPHRGQRPAGCELSDAYQDLFYAWDPGEAQEPARRLRRYAPPPIRDDLDTMEKFAGDLTRIPTLRRKEVLRQLAVFTSDPCTIFGVAS